MPLFASRRDRVVSLGALVIVLVLAAAVIGAVLDAEHNGRNALEHLQQAQVDQLANQLDSEIQAGLGPYASSINSRPWNLSVGNPSDQARLEDLQNANSASRTGYVVVDGQEMVTAGTLLLDPHIIGRSIGRLGLAAFLRGSQPYAVLPVAPGLTTPTPAIATVVRITNSTSGTQGAFLAETQVAPSSTFNTVIASLHRGQSDVYSLVDNNGVVVASSDLATIGHRADPDVLGPQLGFRHVGGEVVATAAVPAAGWRTTFDENAGEFEGSLTGPLRSALLLLIVVGLVGGALAFFALVARLRAAREEQHRLAALSEAREEFISIVSHELRTPAVGQLGFLQTVLDHWGQMTDAERRHTVGQAFVNARRMHALTRDVLDTASIEAGELPYTFENVDVVAAVRSAVQGTPNQDQHPIEITGTDLEARVHADPERVQQVLVNLFDNAAKNSPSGTCIDVRILADGGRVTVQVGDRGPGMTADEMERAFDKFSRGNRPGVQGTGLGLYICRKIIDAHGGRIWASRRAGGGTTISFTLAEAAGPVVPPDIPGQVSEGGRSPDAPVASTTA